MTLCHKELEELETVKKLSVTDRNTYDAVIAIREQLREMEDTMS